MKLWRRIGILGVLLMCLFLHGGGTLDVAAFDYQYPHPNCPPGATCVLPNTECACGMSDIIDGTCSDVSDLNTCAFSCKRYEGLACFKMGSGSCQGAEMPFCEGTAMAVCTGGVWVCDDSGTNNVSSCSSAPVPSCAHGSYCYNGVWYCANNQGCSGTAPQCLDPRDITESHMIPAVCNGGIWVCGIP